MWDLDNTPVAASVGQEGPRRADRVAELVGLEDVVGRDGDDLGVRDADLRVVGSQLEALLVVLRAKPAAREHQDHRVDPLQLAQPTPGPGVVGQLVVGKVPPGTMSARRVCSLAEGDVGNVDGWACRRTRWSPVDLRADDGASSTIDSVTA
jgi:hypothetical protein